MSRKTGGAAKAMGPSGQARLFAALGDATRLRLVQSLSRGEPLSISALGEGAKITRQAITKHLRVLEGAGLVRSVRAGRERLWLLEPERLGEAKAWLAAQWELALENRKKRVESE